MTDRTIARHMKAAIELKAQIKELEKDLKVHQDAIKAEIVARQAGDTLALANHKAIWRPDATENRFNSTRFRTENSELYNAYKEPMKKPYFYLA